MNIFKALFGGGVENLSAADAKVRINSSRPPFVIDVRQPDEFRTGHIAGAKLLPLNELQRRIGELPKDVEILCVCRTGARSGVAARQLVSAGYNAINLSGGMMNWQASGYPVKKRK